MYMKLPERFDALTLYRIDCQRITTNWSISENENSFNTCIMEYTVTEAEIKNCYDFFDMKAKN
ncbi:MAG TPA: hypothetical protein DCF44_05260 [Chitinophagaceae bacterium]|nr:hypothetical protein [Chitinophagaceae bacterium]